MHGHSTTTVFSSLADANVPPGNLIPRPCVTPWDHVLMGAVMLQEGIWYAFVAYYGKEAQPCPYVYP